MSVHHYPAAYTGAATVTRFIPKASIAMGGVGAIIGCAAATAKNIRRVKNAEIDREEAVVDTIRETAGAGIATAVATAVVGAVGATGIVSVLGIMAAAVGAKYLWDSATISTRPSISARAATSPSGKAESEKPVEETANEMA